MKVLVVVDMQNDFITGPLGTPEAQAIVPKVARKIRDFDGEYIAVTRDTHYKDYLETQEGRNLPVVHCVKHSDGWDIAHEISAALFSSLSDDPIFFDKPAFGSVELCNRLADLHASNFISSIELIGLCTDICVISNAMLLKSCLPEVPIVVDASCCAGVTPESHRNALRAMEMCQIKIINEEA